MTHKLPEYPLLEKQIAQTKEEVKKAESNKKDWISGYLDGLQAALYYVRRDMEEKNKTTMTYNDNVLYLSKLYDQALTEQYGPHFKERYLTIEEKELHYNKETWSAYLAYRKAAFKENLE